MSLITLKLTSDFPNLFYNVHKSVDYFNHLLSNKTNSQFYLETISNGFIYFFSNFEILEALTLPFSKKQLNALASMGNHGIEFLFGKFFEVNPFPKEGIRITYEYNGHPMDQIKTRLNDYFISYQSADIQIQNIGPNKLDVKLATLAGMAIYANRLSQILEKYNI